MTAPTLEPDEVILGPEKSDGNSPKSDGNSPRVERVPEPASTKPVPKPKKKRGIVRARVRRGNLEIDIDEKRAMALVGKLLGAYVAKHREPGK